MPFVKNNGAWFRAEPRVFTNNAWTPAKEAWVKKNGIWVREYTRDYLRFDGIYWRPADSDSVALGNGGDPTINAASKPAERSGSFTGTPFASGVDVAIVQRNASEYPWCNLMSFEGNQTHIYNANYHYDWGDGVIRKIDRINYEETKIFGWMTQLQISQVTANTIVSTLLPRIGQMGYFRLIPPELL